MEEIRTAHEALLDHEEVSIEGAPVSESAQALFVELKEFIDLHYKRPEGMYPKARKILGEGVTNTKVLAAMRQTIKQTQAMYLTEKRAQADQLVFRNSRQTVLTLDYVASVAGVLRAGVTFADRALLLMLSCGARKIEVLSDIAQFFRSEKKNFIVQRGFAKKGEKGTVTEAERPLLFITTGRFFELLASVREEVAERDKEGHVAIGKTFSHQLEKRSADLWPQNVANGYRTGTHINRAIYANVAYKLFGKPDESLTHYIKHTLGHESMGTAANYMNIAIALSDEHKLLEKAEELDEKVEVEEVHYTRKDGTTLVAIKPPIQKMTLAEREQKAAELASWLRAEGVEVDRTALIRIGCQSKIITSSGVLTN